MMIKVVLVLVAVVVISSVNGAVSKDRRLYKRAAVKDSWTWPGGVVFYRFSKNLDNAGKRRLQRAMRHIESRTCIKFRERTNEPNYVFMQYDFKDSKCQSNIGYEGGVQRIWISNPKDFKDTGYCGLGDVIHELGHTLGFFHEQARPDRDNYVTINLKNLAPGNKWAASNFDKVDRRWVDYRGVDYDYGSLMHYGKYAFASYGKVTIQPKDRNARIGQKNGLSGPDIAQLNKMYNC